VNAWLPVSAIRGPDAYGVQVPDSDEEDLERLLRNARPAPRPGYARELEGSLHLPHRRKASARMWLAIGVVTALVVVTLVAALAGLLT
jgi:hypothetical protein